MPAKKPLITANQVTFLRLLLMPAPCWLLYQTKSLQLAGLIAATILGCTDFVDGYLARKHGSTVLGGLMDPMADKVFVAIAFLPLVDLGWTPVWLVMALFAREFVVTAARTCYEARGQQLKSTYLARYKTWVQMCGAGIILLCHTVAEQTIDVIFFILAAAPILGFVVRWILVRRPWKGAAAFAVSFTGLFALNRLIGPHLTSDVLMWFIVGVTWVSAFGYLVGLSELRGKGRITGGEVARLLGAAAVPLLAVAAQKANLAPKWAIIALVAVELSHGGLDNLLAHHKAHQGGLAWGARMVLVVGCLSAVLLSPTVGWAQFFAILGFAVAAASLTIAFVQKRQYYLDPKPIRQKPAAAQVTGAPA